MPREKRSKPCNELQGYSFFTLKFQERLEKIQCGKAYLLLAGSSKSVCVCVSKLNERPRQRFGQSISLTFIFVVTTL